MVESNSPINSTLVGNSIPEKASVIAPKSGKKLQIIGLLLVIGSFFVINPLVFNIMTFVLNNPMPNTSEYATINITTFVFQAASFICGLLFGVIGTIRQIKYAKYHA